MQDKPNIIVIMTDQQKATASHLYGNVACETPSLERLAKSGVIFTNAYTPHPLCVPARCSLWTAQYPHQHGSRRNQTFLAKGKEHAFKLWKNMGYTTGLIGKNHCFKDEEDINYFDVWCELGHSGISDAFPYRGMLWHRSEEAINFAHQTRKLMTSKPVPEKLLNYAVTDYPIEDYSTSLIADQSINFINKYKDNPFALWVSFPDPHYPWELPKKYADMFPRGSLKLPETFKKEFGENEPETNRVLKKILDVSHCPENDVYATLGAYYGMIRFIDDKIGDIINALDRLDLRKKTIVVFCSDHGDFMFEYGMVEKGALFFDCLTRIPLIISWPGYIPEGRVSNELVNLIDIVPTLLKLQGGAIPSCMSGQPLPDCGYPVSVKRDFVFAEYGAGWSNFGIDDLGKLPSENGRSALMNTLIPREAEGRRKMVRSRRWKLVYDPLNSQHELYDILNDPVESRNVASNPDNNAVMADLTKAIAEWSISTEDS